MSFWDMSDGETITGTNVETEFEIPSGNMEPIPDGSSVLAVIDEAKWETRDERRYINLRWSVISPDEYRNRKIFHKLWVSDRDPNARDDTAATRKRDRALKMLAAIDANAGGKLLATREDPTDENMTMHLCNKPMVIKCMVWSMQDRDDPSRTIEGNWVAAVAPASKTVEIKPAKAAKAAPAPVATGGNAGWDDSDIPF